MLDARRRACLEAMGIDVWRQRRPHAGSAAATVVDIEAAREPADMVEPRLSGGSAADATPRGASVVALPTAVAGPGGAEALSSVAGLSWPELEQRVATCQACALHEGRTQAVVGVGNRQARLMVIGEAPGADEDRQGEPFVGRAGQLLNLMLAAIGLPREEVYIANIIKCRPPGNRDPHSDETAACRGFLERQIELVAPELVLSVGRISAHNLLGTEESVGRLRGRTHRFEPGDIPLIVTYHPAYLLRRPQEKAKAWSDLQAAARVLGQSRPV